MIFTNLIIVLHAYRLNRTGLTQLRNASAVWLSSVLKNIFIIERLLSTLVRRRSCTALQIFKGN